MPSPPLLPRRELRDLAPYRAARHEHPDVAIAADRGALLDANEHPEDHVAPVAGTIPLNRYPDPLCTAVREALSAWLDVPAANLVCGNGSDELLDLLVRLYGEPGRPALIVPPTYGMYAVQVKTQGLDVVSEPFVVDRGPPARFAIDVERFASAIKRHRASIVFFNTPNNPTGHLVDLAVVRELAGAFPDTLFVVDEAYVEFADDALGATVSMVRQHDLLLENMVVLRTLSKAWGLAGARLGYAVACENVVDWIGRVKLPYNVSALTQAAALSALDAQQENGTVSASVRGLLDRRDRLIAELDSRGLEVLPTRANFFCVRLPEPLDATRVHTRLADEDAVLVRDRSTLPGLERCLRISTGTEVEHERLLAALDRVLDSER